MITAIGSRPLHHDRKMGKCVDQNILLNLSLFAFFGHTLMNFPDPCSSLVDLPWLFSSRRCYIEEPDGSVVDAASIQSKVCWWHMADGKVLGLHEGQLVEYDTGKWTAGTL